MGGRAVSRLSVAFLDRRISGYFVTETGVKGGYR
jgi:hypothetical protein